VPAKWHENSFNGSSKAQECDSRQMTDHAKEKCVAIGKITCVRAISPNHAYSRVLCENVVIPTSRIAMSAESV